MSKIQVDTAQKYQVIESFGVSGAWWAQSAGGWTEPDEAASGLSKRERIAQLLFDKEKGIGISAYRYNLGAGSMNSGAGRYSVETRRAESFDISDTEYDWSRDANAVWMLREAVRLGVREVIFFANSPPERMTKNHKAYQDYVGQTNLAKKNYDRFAAYCLDVTEHFIKEGIPVAYLSPVNEPVWFWLEKQEGCHYRPWQVRGVMKAFARAMDRRPALKGLKLSGAENGDIRWFNKTYCRVMLNDETIRRKIDAIDTHSYCIKAPVPFINNRLAYMRRYKKWMDRHYPGVPLKTSEWTHMRGGRDYGMDSALEQAKVMCEDLTVMDVASWQLWIALSDVDFCDGLIYQFHDTRTYRLTKRYFAFGNFSKYIPLGGRRVSAVPEDPSLMAVAFEKAGEVALLVVNPTESAKTVSLRAGKAAGKMYVTSDADDLEAYDIDLERISLSPRSISTICYACGGMEQRA